MRHEKHLFILLDSSILPPFFIEFLHWIRDQPMYEDDYVYDNIQKTTFHMIVLRIPQEYYNSFETFKLGEYSKMYNKATIESFFHKHPDVQKVLIKDHNYKIVFVEKVNRRYHTSIKPEEWEGELDFTPDEKEIFNHHLKRKI